MKEYVHIGGGGLILAVFVQRLHLFIAAGDEGGAMGKSDISANHVHRLHKAHNSCNAKSRTGTEHLKMFFKVGFSGTSSWSSLVPW